MTWLGGCRKWVNSGRKIVYWFPLGIVLAQDFVHVKHIKGRSMQPTLNPDSSAWKDIALFNRFSVWYDPKYKRDDIVCFRSPDDPKHILVKRVIAVPGDTVTTLSSCYGAKVDVPEGHLWVEGDEPFYSDDSNLFGPIPMALVESKLLLILWPYHRAGRLSTPVVLPQTRSGPAYRHAMDAIERDRGRHARVQVSR